MQKKSQWQPQQRWVFKMHSRGKLKLIYAIGSIAGLLFSAFFCIFLNQYTSETNKVKLRNSTAIKVAPPKQKQKKIFKKKSKPKPQNITSTKPQLSAQLSQLSFGGSGLNWFSTDRLTKKLSGNIDDIIMTADTVDEIPTVKSTWQLEYPDSARNTGTQGYVTISFIITKQGKVKKPNVVNSQPAGVFDSYAMASLKNWVFNPAKYEGKPVRVWSEQTIRFDLN